MTLKAQEANDLLEMIERLQFEREHYVESNRVGAEALKAEQSEIERLRGVEADARRMKAFCREALDRFYEGDGTMQDMAERHGLLIPTEVTEPCGEGCVCAEYVSTDEFPTTCYKFAPCLRTGHVIAASRSTGAADVGEDHG